MNEGQWQNLDLFAPTEEHRLLRQTLDEFVAREVEPQALEYNREERFNHSLFRQCGELGLLGVTLPEEYGGAGMDALAAVHVMDAIGGSDPAFALSILAHAILFAQNVNVNGNDSQRGEVLPKATSGEWVCGMAMTEPEAGTDVMAMKTRAERDGDGYVLNGRKTFITNGGIDECTLGDAFVVYAATSPRRISAFLVEKGTAGFSLGQKWTDKLGMRASFTAELLFDNVRVPADRRLGAEGEGTLAMMRNLEIERLALAAISVGIARRCVDVMVAYASERKAFGVPLREHGQIQKHIAESFVSYRAAATLVYDIARRFDLENSGQRVEADSAKLFAAGVGKRVADSAIQVLGGNGYMGEYVVERLWRDAKLIEIGGGTLEAHHANITKDLSRKR
jgi:isovaleryl-CoA dehydrogenase